MNSEKDNFSWELLDAETAKRKKIPNSKIKTLYNDLVYNHSNYAVDYYEQLLKHDVPDVEPEIGNAFPISEIVSISDAEIDVIVNGYECNLEMNSERPFITNTGFDTVGDFMNYIKTEEGTIDFLQNNYYVVIEQVRPYLKGSLTKGQLLKVKDEFFDQIKSETAAYYGKILEKNHGGFLINVQGIIGFLPGSLAAANIVRNFDDMVGKTIPVMVEDYLQNSDTFVFSYKKYVKSVLPQKVNELAVGDKYTGTVTGSTKFGVFIEFDDIFTGLLHTTKMSEADIEKFNKREFKPNDSINFWIQEITHDKKIILTSIDPALQRQELEEYRKKIGENVISGEIINVKPFGITVRLSEGFVGIIPGKEFKTQRHNKFALGDNITVKVGHVSANNKLHLKFAESK